MKPTTLEEKITVYLRNSLTIGQAARARRILQIVKEHTEREGETQLEIVEHGGGGNMALIITDPDGQTRHLVYNPSALILGEPRPTVPGTYWNPDKPFKIYTLHRNGIWRSNLAPTNLGGREIPDGLTLLGAFE